MSLKKQAISGVKWTGVSTAIIAAIRFTQVAVLARLLSPTDFGLMAMAIIVIDTVIANLDLGVSAGIIHYQDTTRDELSSLFWMNIITGGVIFAALLLGRSVISGFFNEPRLFKILSWISISFIIFPLSSQFRVLLEKELRFNFLAKQEVFSKFCEGCTAIILATRGYGVWSLVVGYLVGMATGTLVIFSYGMMHYRPSVRLRYREIRKYLSFGLYQMGSRTVGLITEKLDQFLIGSMLGTQDLGYYYFAYNISNQPITRVAPVLVRVFFPIFSKAQNDSHLLKRAYLKVLKSLMYMIAPLSMGMAVLATAWIIPLFGEKWKECILLVQILSMVAIAKAPAKTYSSLIMSKGKINILFYWSISIALFKLILLYTGAALYGVNGLVIFLLFSQLCLLAPGYLYLVRPFIGKCLKDYLIGILKPLFFSFVMAIFVFGVIQYEKIHFTYLILEICFGGIIYLLLLFIFDRKTFIDMKLAVLNK